MDGRQINVELAKPPTATAAGRAPKEAATAAVASDATSVTAVQENGEAKTKKSKSNPRVSFPIPLSSLYRVHFAYDALVHQRKGARKPRTDGETEEVGDAPVAELASKLESTTLDTPTDGAAPTTSSRGRGGRRGRGVARGGAVGAREKRVPTGAPSKTLIFAANLAFSMTDEALKALFQPYGVVSAHVVTKKYGHDEGRSKGFGFVEVESEAQQLKALSDLQGKEVEGRELALKVALQQEKDTSGDTGLAQGEIIAT